MAVSSRKFTDPWRQAAAAEQHPLWFSVILHLSPGAALTGFVILVHAGYGVEPLLGLLVGILVVLTPLGLPGRPLPADDRFLVTSGRRRLPCEGALEAPAGDVCGAAPVDDHAGRSVDGLP
jgi:hypothetical protein